MYRRRHQEPAEECQARDCCTWSAPNMLHPEREPAGLFETEPWLASLDLGQEQDHHKLGPGTKATSTAGNAEPRPV